MPDDRRIQITLPPVFYFDHKFRDCESGVILKETKRGVTVEIDYVAFADLLSDAEYYSDASDFDSSYFGLVSSARATVRKLRTVDPHVVVWMKGLD